eukprot:m.157223 g.157223  ORF g.157223 m.157223 type:complete len:332 (+) comp17578_c3_seq1:53-1048(+)
MAETAGDAGGDAAARGRDWKEPEQAARKIQTWARQLLQRRRRRGDGVDDNGHNDNRQQPAGQPDDEKMCRICFGVEQQDTLLGRLFSPCQCRGSMRFVHTGCLDQWRHASVKSTSYFQCDQCGFRYNMRRAQVAAWLRSPFLAEVVTVVAFLLALVLAGYLYRFLEYTGLVAFCPEPTATATTAASSQHEEAHHRDDAYQPGTQHDGGGSGGGSSSSSDNDDDADFYDEGQAGLFQQLLCTPPTSWLPGLGHLVRGGVLAGLGGCLSMVMHMPGLYFGNGAPGRSSGVSSWLFILLVVVGLARTAWAIYSWVNSKIKDLLKKSELEVLEVR